MVNKIDSFIIARYCVKWFHCSFKIILGTIFIYYSLSSYYVLAADCGGNYAIKIYERQKSLIEVYGKSIEYGNNKEIMSAVEQCVQNLKSIFRNRASFPILTSDDLYQVIKRMLEKVVENLCNETITSIKREEQEWASLFETVTSKIKSQTIDWDVIFQQNKISNRTFSSTITSRIKEIIR